MTDKGSTEIGGMNSEHATETIRQTIVATLEAPCLKGTTKKNFNIFPRERELYEKMVTEKNGDPGVSVTATTYKASIGDNIICLFITFGWIDVSTISDISEEQLKACVRTRATQTPKENELGRVEATVQHVEMDNRLPLIEDRVFHIVHMYLETLEVAGFENLPESKPHVAIRHIMKRLQPTILH